MGGCFRVEYAALPCNRLFMLGYMDSRAGLVKYPG
jgi:hypothetical protein